MTAARRRADPAGAGAGPRSVSRSHVGLVRAINEDRVFDWSEGGLWAVVDGMGGHRGGDLAAQAVVDALRALADDGAGPSSPMVAAALERANAAIVASNAARGEQAGATVVAMTLYDGVAHILWAGDSRAYRLRGSVAELLTRDHSVVQELTDAGLLTPAAAMHHPQANVVTNALGVAPDCDLDATSAAYAPGDRFLLCSDGLSRTMATDGLDQADVAALADMLLSRALADDGTDNISLIVIDPA